MRAAEVIGKGVVTTDGALLGKVADLILDLEGWRVRELVISLSKDVAQQLGMKRLFGSPKVAVPVSYVSGVKDVISLSTDSASLKSAVRQI